MLLQVHGLTKYFGGLAAVRAVDFEVAPGEIVGLIGPNGSGKTTAFNLISGFFRPDGGQVVFDGEDVTGWSPSALCKRGICRTFQLVRPFPSLSALDNVAVGRIYGRDAAGSRAQARTDAEGLLDLVGLRERGETRAQQLTLVDRKRLELARSLAARPKLLLLDELLAGLNPSEVIEATELIRRVRDSGVTIMLVEHLVKAVFGLSDRIIVLNAGEKIAEGSPSEVAGNQQVVDAYLGTAHHA